MKNFLKQIRVDLIISSVICIIGGIILMVRPLETLRVFCQVIAVVLMLAGALFIIGYFLKWMNSIPSLAMGVAVFLIGILLFLNPDIVGTLISVVVGLLLLFHGVSDLQISLASKEYGGNGWKIGTVLAVVGILAGIVCIINVFLLGKLAIIILGIALIYNGISNLLITCGVSIARKRYQKQTGPIDVQFKDGEKRNG